MKLKKKVSHYQQAERLCSVQLHIQLTTFTTNIYMKNEAEEH